LRLLDSSVKQQWIGLKFLRVNRALMAYVQLEKTGFVAAHFSELTRALLVMLLKTLALTVSMAGVIMVLPLPHEPPPIGAPRCRCWRPWVSPSSCTLRRFLQLWATSASYK